MNSNCNSPLLGKYVKRDTNEPVEVIAHEQVENGNRCKGDWVTYIDSNGIEHIKEPLNLQLDFKVSDELANVFENLLKPLPPLEKSVPKLPSIDSSRVFEVAKCLIVHKDYKVKAAINKGIELVKTLNQLVGRDSEL